MPKLNKTLTFAVNFAHKAAQAKCKPHDFAVLIALADRVHSTGTAHTNYGTEETNKKLENARKKFEDHAENLGLGWEYNGLYPTLKVNGEDFWLPG